MFEKMARSNAGRSFSDHFFQKASQRQNKTHSMGSKVYFHIFKRNDE